jgi:hypothetical protein
MKSLWISYGTYEDYFTNVIAVSSEESKLIELKESLLQWNPTYQKTFSEEYPENETVESLWDKYEDSLSTEDLNEWSVEFEKKESWQTVQIEKNRATIPENILKFLYNLPLEEEFNLYIKDVEVI